MVDIGTATISATRTVSGTADPRVIVHAGRDAALAAVDATPSDAVCSAYQRADFLRAWVGQSPHEPVFVSLRPANSGPVLLPLERTQSGNLAYPGERHANGNFPVGRAEDLAALADLGESRIVSALRAAGLGADAIVLERQLAECGGVANPFVFSRSHVSPNPALSLPLEGGFDAVLKRHSSKRRRKRFRGQERRLAEMGGYRFVPLVDADDINRTLDRFSELKAKHFQQAGIHDVFADPHVRGFFKDLFAAGLNETPPSRELKTIEVGGVPIAIIGCTVHDGCLTVEFGTYASEYSEIGPGDMLFFMAIREAAERGLDIFSFGIGDEPYKRGWCEIEALQSDTVIALTLRGRAVASANVARSTLVRAIKSNKLVWTAVKQIRKRVAILR